MIQRAAYNLHLAMIAGQEVINEAFSQVCEGGEEGEAPCVHPNPVPALEAVRPPIPPPPPPLAQPLRVHVTVTAPRLWWRAGLHC